MQRLHGYEENKQSNEYCLHVKPMHSSTPRLLLPVELSQMLFIKEPTFYHSKSLYHHHDMTIVNLQKESEKL